MGKDKETLNEEEKELPTDTGQSENEITDETEDDSIDESTDVDELTKDDSEDDSKDESVTIPKTEYEKLKSDLDNYREGLIAIKKKGLKLPPTSTPKPEPQAAFDESENYLTKEEYYKGIEQAAIQKALSAEDMPELGEHWDDIMLFYANRHGNTVEGYSQNIRDAYYLWEKNISSPKNEEKLSTKRNIAGLVQEQGISKGKQKETTPQKKSVIPKKESIGEWYK